MFDALIAIFVVFIGDGWENSYELQWHPCPLSLPCTLSSHIIFFLPFAFVLSAYVTNIQCIYCLTSVQLAQCINSTFSRLAFICAHTFIFNYIYAPKMIERAQIFYTISIFIYNNPSYLTFYLIYLSIYLYRHSLKLLRTRPTSRGIRLSSEGGDRVRLTTARDTSW